MTTEELKKAKECKSVKELMSLAKENGKELTEEQTTALFARLNTQNGELADDELDNVAGGCIEDKCPKCGCTTIKHSYKMRDGISAKCVVCSQCEEFIMWL